MMKFEIGVGMSVGRLAYWHNIRANKDIGNVNPELSKDNVIVVDKIQGRTIDKYLDDEMQPYINQYNEKQKRKDRRIEKTYTEWHRSNGLYTQNAKTNEDVHLAREFVLSFGNHDNLGKAYYEAESEEEKKLIYDQAVRLYSKWFHDFEKLFPHLSLDFACIHCDEPNGTIHGHGIISPRATYTRGIPVQCCWSKALEQDGIEKIADKELAMDAGGFQLARLYKDFREHMKRDLVLEDMPQYTLQREEHGKTHMTKTAFTQKMEIADRKANAIDFLEKESKELDEIEIVREYDPSKIKKVEVKTGGVFSKETEIEVRMPLDVFDSLRSSSDSKSINRSTREKIERQRKMLEEYIDLSSTPKEKELRQEVNHLREELEVKNRIIEEKEIVIKQKDRMIDRLNRVIDVVRDFLKERGLYRMFEGILDPERNRER